MAKGQKKSNREVRKPKQAKAKSAEPASGFLKALDRPSGASSKGGTGGRS